MKLNEHQEQKILVRWYRLQYTQYAKYLFAIPNGGVRHIGTAIKIKDEGGMAGVSDLFLMIPKAGWHGMWIAMDLRKQNTQLTIICRIVKSKVI
jgi:hypothetical protein